MGENGGKTVFVNSRINIKLRDWIIIQSYWDWFKKIMPLWIFLQQEF